MLYQLGAVTIDARGFNADKFNRSTEASMPEKGLIGGLSGAEHTGFKGDITLSGVVLPFHKGGYDSLELLHAMCREGQRVMVVRGDGTVLGWHAITKVDEGHEELAFNGVGYVVKHSLSLSAVQAPGMDGIGKLISQILSLFG